MKWIIFCVALSGLVMNIRKKRAGFVLWLISNGYWAVYNWRAGEYEQGLLFLIFWFMSIIGFFAWSGGTEKQKPQERR